MAKQIGKLKHNFPRVMVFWLYCVLSFFLFLSTTTGWSGLLYFMFAGPYFLGVMVILLLISFFTKIDFREADWRRLGLYQVILILLNFGDCSDGVGTHNYFQMVGKTKDMLCNVPGGSPQAFVSFEIFVALLFIYALYLLGMVFFSPVNSTTKKSK